MKISHILLLLLILSAFNISAQEISRDNIEKNLKFLSGEELKGRLPGTQGFETASEYCKTIFKNLNFQSFEQCDNFTQIVKIENARIIGPCDFSIIHYKRGRLKHIHGVQYNFRGFTGSGEKTLETVFCGYGISQSDYDDYAKVDVKGKAVILFKGESQIDNIKTESFTIRNRIKTAVEHGAEAVIFVTTPNNSQSTPIGSMMDGEGEHYTNIPVIQIDLESLELLLEGTEINSQTLFDTIKHTGKPYSLQLLSKIFVNVDAVYHKEIDSYNSIAFLPGTDPELKNEYILITAHIDHVGSQCGVIYPGANDNASGCVAVLELAKIFSETTSKRSIIFVLLTAEESGLLGSTYLANNLPVDQKQIVAAFNFDCVASGDSIQIGNGLSSPELYKIAVKSDTQNLMVKNTWAGGGADLTAFTDIEIPGLYFVTKYSYTNLHLPTDTYENCNIPLLLSVIELAYRTITKVADGKYVRENPMTNN